MLRYRIFSSFSLTRISVSCIHSTCSEGRWFESACLCGRRAENRLDPSRIQCKIATSVRRIVHFTMSCSSKMGLTMACHRGEAWKLSISIAMLVLLLSIVYSSSRDRIENYPKTCFIISFQFFFLVGDGFIVAPCYSFPYQIPISIPNQVVSNSGESFIA